MIEQLTAQQRKLAYLMGIVILMLPIIVLGMPAADEEGSGGKLARLLTRRRVPRVSSALT